MRARFTTALFLLTGFINFIPILGVAGQAKLEALYGASLSSPDVLMLMQHRALMFGIVGGIMLIAAFRPMYRTLAAGAGMISMVGFEILYLFSPTVSAHLGRVAAIDAVAVLLLGAALWLGRVSSGPATTE